uniref:Glutamyl-tRNA(Gln) amidotransferase subunit A, mitochondrial n=1 Tax=Timema cristinae TaxID=61476 RepID=A0A7R9CUV1_TIMCR|nr:unnamed protein product [Timema cristinae]
MILSNSIRYASNMLKDGIILPSELCGLCFSRVELIQPLNPFVCVLKESATAKSYASNDRYSKGKLKGPLDGIPVAVKDNFCMHSIPTTCCSRMLKSFKPGYNATVVERLNAAGAIILGKCNMDEFGMGSGTIDSIYGPTKNVWLSKQNYTLGRCDFIHGKESEFNQEISSDCEPEDWYISGGSSGGSAVAVASGAVFAALGSDTGGSTRNPAAYCGIVGFKPSYGLVSRHGLVPLVNSMDVPGILTKTIDDAATMFNVLAGHDPLDSTTVRTLSVPLDLKEEINIKQVTVGIAQEYHCHGLSNEILNVWSFVADLLESSGAKVIPVSMPHTQTSIACYAVLNHCEVASNMARYDGIEFGLRAEENISTEELYASSRSKGFNEVVRGRILAGNYFLLRKNYEKYFVKAMKIRSLISRDFSRVWNSGVDVLLTPTTLTTAPLNSEFRASSNREQCAIQDYCTQPANMAGCPAVTIPIKLSEQGLPISLQIMAPYLREDILLSVAKWIENRVHFPVLHLQPNSI